MSIRKLLIFCGIALLVLIIIDIFVIGHDAHFWWHGFVGFDAIYGILGCLVTILFSKALGKLFIRRKDDYYPEDYKEGGDGND